METVKPLIIALDGRSGAGKTSLANAMTQILGSSRVALLHVEDLYQGWQSLAATGRRLAGLLETLRSGQQATWTTWDWAANTLGTGQRCLAPREIVIVEGVGSLHAAGRPHIDLGIWLDADDELRKTRALGRDGDTFTPHWQLWAEQEQEYLDTEHPREAADLLLDAESPDSPLEQFRRLARFLPPAIGQGVPVGGGTDRVLESVQLPAPEDAASLFEAISAGCRDAALLESTSHGFEDPLGRNRYTILALAQRSTSPRLTTIGQQTTLDSGAGSLRLGTGFFDALGGIWPASDQRETPAADTAPLPQWVGYLGYELKRELGARDLAAHLPDGSVRADARFFEPDTLLVIDHQQRTLVLKAPASLLESTEHRVRQLLGTRRKPAHLEAPVFSCPDSAAGYRQKVRAAKEQIREGNTYEVCLTTELQAVVDNFSPFEAYCRLRVSSPAPFAHYLRLGELEVASISPERFVSISPTGKLRAEPIKGTRPRGIDEQTDLALRHDLATHPKDRAENIMIVDLLRNDLSHYAVPGSLAVTRLCAVETYATVHQMVSTIDAQLRDRSLAAAALRETFPPGSMTGAPKLSTMNILDHLEEGRARGLYSGAVGYLGADGSADLAVVIRTLVCDHLADGRWRLGLGLGGAITADSDPQEEWDEVRTKSVGVLGALGSAFPVPLHR